MTTQDTIEPRPENSPPDNHARIDSLRRQIAAGTYRIDSSALADALIRHLQQKPRRRVA